MLSMNLVYNQICIILLYVAIGFVAGKSGLIRPDQRKYLTRICTDLILPFTVLSATDQSLSRSEIAYLGLIALMIMGLYIVSTFLSLRVQSALGTPRPVQVTTASLMTYPNCTFLGLPLCQALFGNIAILYNCVALVAFNVLFFTWQYSMFTGKGFNLKKLITPPTLATVLLVGMLALGLHFPGPVQTVVHNTGAMISPLSLIIVGVMMSENHLTAILQEKRAYVITLVRNLVFPLLFLLLLLLLRLDPSDKLCLLVYMACPCATLTTIYAIQNDMAPSLAANSVLMSTMSFALTLPLIITIGTRVLY